LSNLNFDKKKVNLNKASKNAFPKKRHELVSNNEKCAVLHSRLGYQSTARSRIALNSTPPCAVEGLWRLQQRLPPQPYYKPSKKRLKALSTVSLWINGNMTFTGAFC
jgi:hypothetical protein